MFDVGRLCVKIAGREAGRYCVILKRVDSGFVLVTGPRSVTSVRRRKCNVFHLEPLKEAVQIKEDASDEDVLKAYREASIFSKLNLPIPQHAGHEAEAPAKEHETKPPEKKKRAPRKKPAEA